MPERRSGPAASAVLAALLLVAVNPAARADSGSPISTAVVVSVPDSATAAAAATATPSASSVALAMRAAYQNAWAQRQAGDFEACVSVSEAALREVNDALSHDPDMATRRDLTD